MPLPHSPSQPPLLFREINSSLPLLLCPSPRLPLTTTASCFVGTTLVTAQDGVRHPLASLRTAVGRLRLATVAGLPDALPNDHDTQRQWLVSLCREYDSGDQVEIHLLRDQAWVEQHRVQVGEPVWLDLPEMAVCGPTMVQSLTPAPVPPPGRRGLLTGWFQHSSGTVFDLTIEGESQPLGVTATHPFWSVTRQQWVWVGDLGEGEALLALQGTYPRVRSVAQRAPRGRGGECTTVIYSIEDSLLARATQTEGPSRRDYSSGSLFRDPAWVETYPGEFAPGDVWLQGRTVQEHCTTVSYEPLASLCTPAAASSHVQITVYDASDTPFRVRVPVFNLEVAGEHCYRVGEQGLLVHNASCLWGSVVP